MADNRQDLELLFFETFSHENAEELNLDLVQFPRPVVIGEVRVVPLQTRVQADVRGGERLGATNPSNFKLELFVNNLGRPNASTFEMLGVMEYKANDEIQLVTEVKIPTDGLILKGWYKTLTIAIYGVLTDVNVEPEALPPPPPPQPRKQAVSSQPAPQLTTVVAPSGGSRDHRSDHQEWEPPTQPLVTPHTTQHPLDYIQQQLQQASIQSATHTVSVSHQAHPVAMVPHPVGPPGQIPLGVPPPTQIKPELQYHPDDYGRHALEKDQFSPGMRPSSRDRDIKSEAKDHYDNRDSVYEDSRSRDSWGYHDREPRGSRERLPEGRDYPTSREGSREPRDRDNRDSRDREYRDYRDDRDRDWDRDKRDKDKDRDKKGSRDRLDYERDSKERDRGRGYDDRDSKYDGKRERDLEGDRERGYDRDRDREREVDVERDRDRGRDYDRDYDRNRDKDYDRGREREGYRDQDRGRERDVDRGQDAEGDRGREWEGERGVEREMDRGARGREIERVRDSRGFRDRTREDYREMAAPREVYMETEAPRSPSRSRSRSYSPDHISSHSPSPNVVETWPRSPTRQIPVRETRMRQQESPLKELMKAKEFMEDPMSPSLEEDPVESDLPGSSFDALSADNLGSPMEQNYPSDYEAISSEDEFIDIEGDIGLDFEMDEEVYNYSVAPFNPYQFEGIQLMTFRDVSQTEFEQEKCRLVFADSSQPGTMPLEAQQLLDIVDKFTSADHHDSWVEAMEGVPSLLPRGLSHLLYKENNTTVLAHLIQWAVEGLDESRAMAQPESAYKVRHLKMGFKLAGALCSCDSDIAVKMLREGVQMKLLDNFRSQFMSFSLKLQIIAALDQTTRLQDGIQWFLGVHPEQTKGNQARRSGELSGYQTAIKCLLQKQVVRVVVAMTALIKKIHVYEVMNKLGQQLDSIADNAGDLADLPTKMADESGEEGDLDQLGSPICEADLDGIITCLDETHKAFSLANTLIAQPGRTLPGKAMFDSKSSPTDPYPGLFHLANKCRLLESVLFLASCPTTSCMPTVFGAVRTLIQRLYSTHQGLLYLASRSDVTNKIVQALVQMGDYNREDVSDDNAAQQLGLELIFRLQTLSLVDRLLDYNQKTDKNLLEDQAPVTVLHTLYTMTFTPMGRAAVVQVLTFHDNIKAFLPFVQVTGNERDDAKQKKCVCSSYTTELLNIVIHYSDNVSFLEKHGEALLALGESEFSSKLTRLKDWLSPLKTVSSFSSDNLSVIIEQLRTHSDDILKLPRGLITILRILKYLAIAPLNEYPDEKNDEMKYKFVLIELFSGDCFPIFVNILQKLSELMLRPWQRGIPRSSELLALYLSIIRPCLEMIKSTTQYLIMARGTEFHDLTTLPVLFDLHTVLCSVPASSMVLTEIQAIQRDIIDTMAAYTQPLCQIAEAGDKISQSLWTLALRDLLKYTMKAPYTYLSGLQILSELLPLPLPLQTREPLSNEESSLAVNTRKLWSAHLLPLHGALHNIIRTLAGTSCQPLQQILRKICWQMSDLAAPTATMIVECIMDILLEHIDATDKEAKVEGIPIPDQKNVLATRARFLNLLAYLLSQPAIKCTMLRLIGTGGEEKYQSVLEKMLNILNEVSERQEHIQDQECIVSILQSFCDMEVTLTPGDTSLTFQEQVANALPTSDQLKLIIEALLEHIAHPNHKYDTVLPCIRALVMLTEHDQSFYLLKLMFEKHKVALYRLLQRIKYTFSKDSSDCLSTFSTTLEFLRLLVSAEPPDADMPLTRTITLTNAELREVVAWTQNLTTHPLVDLHKLLEDGVKEEETLDTLLESVNSLLTVLRNDSPVKQKPDVTPPILPEPQQLVSLFNIRSTYTVTDPEDERLSLTFWQTMFEPDEPDLVPCDIEEICKKYCNDFNLEEELKKESHTPEEELTKPKKLKDRRKSQEFVTWRGRGMRRPFVAPMRGRGIARGLAAQANRHDPFRSRPPNTSRPPSMHVDDFMKLEKSSVNREGSPSSNNQPIRREGDFNRGRGRGFDRGRGGFDRGRGRFMTPPGSFRRDISFRGGRDPADPNIYINRSKPPFVNPRSFGNTGHERSLTGDRRDNRGGRFEHRGGRGSWNRGSWQGQQRFKDERFPAVPGFRGGRSEPNRHQRSFTK